MPELLEPLGDRALAWVLDLADRRGPESLYLRAPKIVSWLQAEAARELARRGGEDVEPADPVVSPRSVEELERTARAMTVMAIALRNYGVEGTGNRPVDDDVALLELLGLFEALAAAARDALALHSVPRGETTH